MIWVVAGVCVVLVSWCLLEAGYQAGVRETERRWSGAVRRAEHARAKEGEKR